MTFKSIQLFRIAVVVMASLSAGCASIFSGTSQEMVFNSNPDGATVTVDGREVGKTPLAIKVPRGSAKPLLFNKDGYKPLLMQMDSDINPFFWINILCTYGSTTDGLTGAVHKYSPSQYMVTLMPLSAGSLPIEQNTSLSENQKIKDFVVISYRQIRTDLSKGGGDYLKSLLSMLNTPAADFDATVKKIRGLAEAYPTIPEFADRVIDLAPKNIVRKIEIPLPVTPAAGGVPPK
jgi:hypothetical protein